jgi:hypothetical protein
VEDPATRGGSRNATGPDRDSLLSSPVDPIRVFDPEETVIFRVWFEVKDTAGEHLRDGIVKMNVTPPNPLTPEAQERHGFIPLLFSSLSESHFYLGVTVVIPRDGPLKSETDQRRWFNNQFSGPYSIRGDQVGGDGKQE